MRPRKADIDLPRGVYRRHGAYYRVIRGVWYRLGTTEADISKPINEIRARIDVQRSELLRIATRVLRTAKNNAKGRRKIPFQLEIGDAEVLLVRAGWRCSVTGLPFTTEVVNGKKPYAPSVDRIDSNGPYSLENTRLVCVAANYAMNVWGEDVLHRMAKSTRRVLDCPKVL